MKSISLRDLADQIAKSSFPVFVCGAGISYGAAPLAQALEDGLFAAICRLAQLPDEEASTNSAAGREIQKEYLTLELLVSFISYRLPELRPVIQMLYQEIFQLKEVTRSHRAIAKALANKKLGAIVTSNFDNGLQAALTEIGSTSRVITAKNAANFTPQHLDICAFHGTVFRGEFDRPDSPYSKPTSITARELAHPFDPQLAAYLTQVFEKADSIYFVGYRGEDYYDFNPLVESYLRSAPVISAGKKFYVVPHMGQESEISGFLREKFANNVLCIEGANTTWLADLCEQLTNTTIKSTPTIINQAIKTKDVEKIFLELIEIVINNPADSPASNGRRRQRVSAQCRSLISDINDGILAVWTITEHFRLESIGLSSSEISAFGRPPQSLQFQGIPVRKLLVLQQRYWEFNGEFRDAKSNPVAAGAALLKGAQIFKEFAGLVEAVERHRVKLQRNIEKAVSHQLVGICTDYMGLIAMRFESHFKKDAGKVEELLGDSSNSYTLFERTVFEAGVATGLLQSEARSFSQDVDYQLSYAKGLQKLVGTQSWSIIATENLARSDHLTDQEKVRRLDDCIEARFKQLKEELDGDADSLDFSIPAIAPHCALRIAELARIVSGVGETLPPNFQNLGESFSLRDILEKQAKRFRECFEMAQSRSWQKHLRFLIGFDVLILQSLQQNDVVSAQSAYNSAREYASNLPGSEKVLNQLQSRFGDHEPVLQG